jgi:hypothetical protein
MQVITCVPAITTASGGTPPELAALQGILAQLNQINGNTDLVESLQTAGNAALASVASYVDGLEVLIAGLQTSSSSLESLMTNLGINTDGIEALLLAIQNASELNASNVRFNYLQGWVITADITYPALILIHTNQATGVDISIAAYSSAGTSSPILAQFGTLWGVGNVPVVPVVNTPGSFGVTGIVVTSMPVASVKSVTLISTTGATDYSTNAGASWVTIANGSRTWASQAGASLNVDNMRFRGTLVGSMYDIIYEV